MLAPRFKAVLAALLLLPSACATPKPWVRAQTDDLCRLYAKHDGACARYEIGLRWRA